MVEIKDRLSQLTLANTLPKSHKPKDRPKLCQSASKANARQKDNKNEAKYRRQIKTDKESLVVTGIWLNGG